MSIDCTPFGTLPDGRSVERFRLRDDSGVAVAILDYGATIQAIEVPDRNGVVADVVLGHDDIEDYRRNPIYLGATVGRFANRIARGRCTIDGRELQLTINSEGNHLHGGANAFHNRIWEPRVDGAALVMSTRSPDGEEGYPGNLSVSVHFELADGALRIDYTAATDAATPVNFTNHSYFNLAGHDNGDILAQELALASGAYLPTSNDGIPLGPVEAVAGGPFDFSRSKTFGRDMKADHEQLRGGFDHNFVLAGYLSERAGFVRDPASGRSMAMHTDQPGVQLDT